MFVANLKNAIDSNEGKIPLWFTEQHLNSAKVTHAQVTPNTRVCVITLTTGHDLVGYAQVLDAENDVELVGQEIAYNNAKEEIWRVFGSIGKVI